MGSAIPRVYRALIKTGSSPFWTRSSPADCFLPPGPFPAALSAACFFFIIPRLIILAAGE